MLGILICVCNIKCIFLYISDISLLKKLTDFYMLIFYLTTLLNVLVLIIFIWKFGILHRVSCHLQIVIVLPPSTPFWITFTYCSSLIVVSRISNTI